jgi:thiosulfate/3-mercaptopyruvate sulfurtransferase
MAGMVAWAFLYYGHASTRLLDGGLTKWTAEDRPLSDVASAPEARTFSGRLDPSVLCTLDQAKAAVDDDGAVFWDVRTTEEFDGSQQGWKPPPRLGHLPGAIHVNYTELFDPDDGTLRPATDVTHLLGERGITPESAVSTY